MSRVPQDARVAPAPWGALQLETPTKTLSANSNLRASVAAAWGVDPFERVVDFLVGQRRPTDRVVRGTAR